MNELVTEPLVSVCIPVYNHEKYVSDCLLSIIGQDYRNIELIVIDDGSKDDSIKFIEQMIIACEKRFVRFKFISRENKGLCKTLNEAVEWSRGEFFSAVASDDIWLPEKISWQVKEFRELDDCVAAMSAELQQIDENGLILRYQSNPDHKGEIFDFEDVIFGRSRIPAPAAMIKMAALRKSGGYDETTLIEDFFMWLNLTKMGYKIFLSPRVLVQYRIHGQNTHKKCELMHEQTTYLIEKFAPNERVRVEALKVNLYRAFVAGVFNDKQYAFKILLSGKLELFSFNIITPLIFLIAPRKLFPLIRVCGKKFKYFIRSMLRATH